MQTYCVPLHRSINSDPQNHQGIVLTPEMLKGGIWRPGLAHGTVSDDRIERSFELHRCEHHAEYQSALAALLALFSDNQNFMAVVSLRWCSTTRRLVTAKRVWLTVYHSGSIKLTCSYVVRAGRTEKVHSFLECWEDGPVVDQEIWKRRFIDGVQKTLTRISA